MSALEFLLGVDNKTLLCHHSNLIPSKGIWYDFNPLHSSINLLLLQFILITISSHLLAILLKPLGQSSIVAQIFAGILFGPSVLGHSEAARTTLFPLKGSMVFNTIASFGLMFFVFSMGVKTDLAVITRPGRKAITLGLSVFLMTLLLAVSFSIILLHSVSMSSGLAKCLPFIAVSEAMSHFPVIALLLTELKLINTELGRLAVSAAVVCDVVGFAIFVTFLSILQNKSGSMISAAGAIVSCPLLVVAVAYFVRPFFLWVSKRAAERISLDEKYISFIFFLVILSGFISELIGQHYVLGPVVLGVAVPDGPPLGATLVYKLDIIISGIMYPIYLAASGLKTNVFNMNLQDSLVMGVLVLFTVIVKIGATMLTALYYSFSLREAFVLGLIMNAKGIIELIFYNVWRDNKLLGSSEFAMCIVYTLLVTAFVTPLISYLYNPSRKQILTKRSTIQHIKQDEELRIVVSIHDYENIPTILNLLEVSHATLESPVAVTAIHMVELVGRTAPVLISHQQVKNQKTLQASSSLAGQINNVLRHYEQHNEGCVTIQTFTAMSHREMMHMDISQIAIQNNATVIVLPFHKQWAIDGLIGSVNRAVQDMNASILKNAPCSVGILVDKGVLNGSMSVLTSKATYHVAVIFIGGLDDAEALAYGSRMAKHGKVNLTLMRYLLFGSENSRDRKRDSNLIDQCRHSNIGNPGFVYMEEVVRDGDQLLTSLRGMVDCFDLVIVGQHHQKTQLLMGLNGWIECPELGLLGDMLASPDFVHTASVLVMQQQRLSEKIIYKEKSMRDGHYNELLPQTDPF